MTNMTFAGPSDFTPAKIVYGLFVLGAVLPVLAPVAGVIYAYITRGKAADLDTHLDFQIRTFWIGFLLAGLALIASITMVGIVIAVPLWVFTAVWLLVRLISGIVLVMRDTPISSTGAMGFVAR
ncbi:DUF4870 family protein [Albirhodobacter sp. R86504]|uniref:DUF4870 family protein n=1 Tax=Albirhodobacter sp. R86504 TaxID=3093848 RepID=UPI00366B5EA9